MYIKSFVPRTKQLHIKAIGIVTNTVQKTSELLGTGISVKWKQDFVPITTTVSPQMYRNNVFNNTLYEEYNEKIICDLVNALIK